MAILDLWFASGESSLSVRRFETVERIFDLFEVSVVALSPDEDIDFETIVGKPAALYVAAGTSHLKRDGRRFAGICSHMEQLTPEVTGLSTYRLRIVPSLWLLTQRSNHRIFQHASVAEIVNQILGEWRIDPVWIEDSKQYPKLELRIQYGETDYDFLRRMLEEAGITFYFRDGNGDKGAELVLHDQPNQGEEREGGGIPYVENPNLAAEQECLTQIHISQEVRPGRVTIRDHDFRRRPEYKLYGQSSKGPSPEHLLEQYGYAPGAFLVEGAKGGETPVVADPLEQAYAGRRPWHLRPGRFLCRSEHVVVSRPLPSSPQRQRGRPDGRHVGAVEQNGTAGGPWLPSHCLGRGHRRHPGICGGDPVHPAPKHWPCERS